MSTAAVILPGKQQEKSNNKTAVSRVFAILQLCAVFTLVSWFLGYPFMSEHYAIKSQMHLYEYAMGTLEDHSRLNQKAESDQNNFSLLPSKVKNQIGSDYRILQRKLSRPFLSKLYDSFKVLLLEAPSFTLAWIFFSFLISVAILFRIEGAQRAAWILPIIILAYAAEIISTGKDSPPRSDHNLFPTESLLVERYLDQPLKQSIFDQKNQLQQAWSLYLIQEWAKEVPAADQAEYQKQIFRGNQAFTLARLQAISEGGDVLSKRNMKEKSSLFWMVLYMIWNIIFAWKVNQNE